MCNTDGDIISRRHFLILDCGIGNSCLFGLQVNMAKVANEIENTLVFEISGMLYSVSADGINNQHKLLWQGMHSMERIFIME